MSEHAAGLPAPGGEQAERTVRPDRPEEPAPAVGRPRANPRTVDGPVRDEIVAAAARLFGEQGFAATTMAQIAAAAGLRQSSLYYYFRRKELILQATFTVNRAPLDFLKRIRREPGTAALRLYRLLRFDVVQLCLAPCDVNEVYRISLVQPELFTEFWADRAELHRRTEALIRAGVKEATLAPTDARLTALTLLSANEGHQNWWRQRGELRLDGLAPGRQPRYSPAELGTFVARSALRSLLAQPSTLGRLARQADAFDDLPS